MCSCVTRDGRSTDACQSPFSQLHKLFGKSPVRFTYGLSRYLPTCDVVANACFTRHLNLNPRKQRPLDAPGVVAKVLDDCDAWRLDPFLVRISPKVKNDNDLVDQAIWTTRLLVYALGIERHPKAMIKDAMDSPHSHVWSFCRDSWVSRHRTVHCEQCGVCYDNAWHCEGCATCKAGRYLACDGCGGWSRSGVWDGEEGQKAPDAQKAQRGRSTVSPKKRSRQVDLEPWNDSISEVGAMR